MRLRTRQLLGVPQEGAAGAPASVTPPCALPALPASDCAVPAAPHAPHVIASHGVPPAPGAPQTVPNVPRPSVSVAAPPVPAIMCVSQPPSPVRPAVATQLHPASAPSCAPASAAVTQAPMPAPATPPVPVSVCAAMPRSDTNVGLAGSHEDLSALHSSLWPNTSAAVFQPGAWLEPQPASTESLQRQHSMRALAFGLNAANQAAPAVPAVPATEQKVEASELPHTAPVANVKEARSKAPQPSHSRLTWIRCQCFPQRQKLSIEGGGTATKDQTVERLFGVMPRLVRPPMPAVPVRPPLQFRGARNKCKPC